MIKNLNKRIMTFCVSVALTINGAIIDCEAFDRVPWYEGQFIGGIGEYGTNPRYWYFNGNNNFYLMCAELAMNSWMDTDVNLMADYISFERTTNELIAAIEASVSDDGSGAGYNGYAKYFYNDSVVYPNYCSWDKVFVVYNLTNGNIEPYDATGIAEVYAHEIGHAFGLQDYNDNTNSIMCQWNHGRNAHVPTSADICSAIYIYTK